jgi:hypothetical protein
MCETGDSLEDEQIVTPAINDHSVVEYVHAVDFLKATTAHIVVA